MTSKIKMNVVSVSVLLAMVLSFISSMPLAAGPLPPEVQSDYDKEPQPAPSPPDDAKVYTVTGSSKSGLSGPGGGYAVLTVIMNYYQSGSQWAARAGGKIDLVSGVSYANATAQFVSVGTNTVSPVSQCYAYGNGECTTHTLYYFASGESWAHASTTVNWSAYGHSYAAEQITHTF